MKGDADCSLWDVTLEKERLKPGRRNKALESSVLKPDLELAQSSPLCGLYKGML